MATTRRAEMHACRLANECVLSFGVATAGATTATASLTSRRTSSLLQGKKQHKRSQLPLLTSSASRRSLCVKVGFFSQLTRLFASMGTELAPKDPPAGMQLATFAGGCFWGLELAFQRVHGVTQTSVGYTQGAVANPTYEAVCSGRTGHTEAVQVTYDPNATAYGQLLDAFFAQTDPTTLNRQGNDAGTQYRSGIYYHSPEQKEIAEKALADAQSQIDNGTFRPTAERKIVVELLSAGDYYLAEEYHQQYLEKGGRFNQPQSTEKGCKDKIRCYG